MTENGSFLNQKGLAKLAGQALGFTREYKIGSQSIVAEAYLIDKIILKDFTINRVVAFAADYTGDFSSELFFA